MSGIPATSLSFAKSGPNGLEVNDLGGVNGQQHLADIEPQHVPRVNYDWFAAQPESASSTPSVPTQSAALRWLGVLTSNASGDAFPDADVAQHLDTGFLRGADGDGDGSLTPLQRATRAVDDRAADNNDLLASDADDSVYTQLPWQSENIDLLHDEQMLFNRFLRRICSWVCILRAWSYPVLTKRSSLSNLIQCDSSPPKFRT